MDRTLIFIDPGYDASLGHYMREGELIRKEAEKSGIELKHYVSTSVPEGRAAELGLIRRFSHKAGLDFIEDPEEALSDFHVQLDSILRELREKDGSSCTVLMYTAHVMHLPILACLADRYSVQGTNISVHACIFYLDPEFSRGNGSPDYDALLRCASGLVERFDPGHRLSICTDSERTRARYSPYFRRDLKMLPFPIEAAPGGREGGPIGTSKIRIAYIGNTIKRAGYDFLYSAYKALSQKDIFQQMEFRIKHTPREQLINVFREFLKETRNIVHITDFLSNDQLSAFYEECDMVLLPYSRYHYPCQTSGVVVEAIAKKKILIVPEDTWLSDQVREYGSGETFISDDLDSFVGAIEKVVENFPHYKKNCGRNLERFHSMHSAAHLLSQIGLNSPGVDQAGMSLRRLGKDSPSASDLCRLDLPADREWESIRAEYHYCIPPAWQFRKLMKEGNDYVRSGMYDEAERKYRDVLSAERMSRDNWAAAVLELGQLYLKMGDDDKAEGLFMEACSFQEVSPKSRSALMQAMAYIHLKKKDHGRAREAFNHAMEIDRAGENTEGGTAPGGGKEACRSSAYCNGDAAGETGRLNKQGEDLFARGDIEGALSCFKKALAIDPDDTTANNNMGVVCMQTGMFRESTARFLRVLKKDPYNRDTTINCAELLKSTGDVASAIRLYQAYITVYPDDEEIRQLMTDIMDMKENKDLDIIYVPAFDTAESLADQYYRMLWYMHPVAESIRHIHIPLSLDNITELKLPGYLDPEIVKLESRFKGKITFFPDNEPYLWSRYLEDADIVMKWKLDFTHDDDGIDRLVRDRIEKKKSWDIDREKVQQDGLMYLRMSHDANRNRTADLQESREKFGDFMKRVEHARKGYIFGTGPSLDEAMNHDFSDGVTIACNSMVKNERLMEHLNPEAVVFGDPIFHAGCSRYAGEFRKHLYRLLDKYNAHIIVPFRDYKLYSENMPPKYRGRLIGIPTGGYDEPLNLNLNDMFIVKPTKNILTLLMIPVACTAFEEIGIMGCDGRKIEDNRYFWAHHKESQFNEQMDGIKKAHPAFFAIDYNDYYITHCEILETWLAEAERAGKTILNLTESHIPALQKRSASTVGTPWSGQSAGQENSTEP